MSREELEGLAYGLVVALSVVAVAALWGAVAAGGVVVLAGSGAVFGWHWERRRQRRREVR